MNIQDGKIAEIHMVNGSPVIKGWKCAGGECDLKVTIMESSDMHDPSVYHVRIEGGIPWPQ